MSATKLPKVSGHYWTRAKLVAAAIAMQNAGKTIAAQAIWSRIENQAARSPINQRQRRKQNRQRFAAGDRHAFCR